MVSLYDGGIYLVNGKEIVPEQESVKVEALTGKKADKEAAKKGTIAYSILSAHNTADNMEHLKIRFDSMASHDITFVGIVQTAKASGMEKFPIPYVLTNCHNTLCAVGGTINEDDHMFGLSAAKKYGGIYVPPHIAVIHQYMREMIVKSGDMSIVSDSHTRYGTQGSLSIGEGGPELAKAMLGKYYEIDYPEVIAVFLTGAPKPWVGPMDVALSIIGKVFKNNFVKNKVLEFVGPGVSSLSMDFRNGIDTMTTESACLSSLWSTDEKTEEYFKIHNRPDDYKKMVPGNAALYDGIVEIDLDTIVPMIALPFHPSNAYTIDELNANLDDILADVEKRAAVSLGNKVPFTLRDKVRDGKMYVDQGVIAGCAGGGFENLCDVADMLDGQSIGDGRFSLSVYPASQPVYMELIRNGSIAKIMETGATVRTAFCGPCFGAGDVPANNAFSIRHSTRNFPNREGSKVNNGQIASVALMDARSIAATALNKGRLTAATDIDVNFTKPKYYFDSHIYEKRVYNGVGKADPSVEIQFGPNIKDWPSMVPLTDNILLKVVSEIHDPVTTTDELIPSGETSSFRSNPLGLAEFTLSRKDPEYVGRAKKVRAAEEAREDGKCPCQADDEVAAAFNEIHKLFPDVKASETEIGSVIYAVKPGDGSAREQAASCQRVLGGLANIAKEYATKRYRSNLINWGMIPFIFEPEKLPFANLDYIFVPGIRDAVKEKQPKVTAYAVKDNALESFELEIKQLTDDERQIILDGCLINYYKSH